MPMFQETDIAFVTGGGSGIGRATCRLLAERGATVVVADINKAAADETVASIKGSNHLSIQVDVSQRQSVIEAISEVTDKYSSPPNIAVNCAGVVIIQSLLEVTEETLDSIFNINVKGTFWVTQAVCQTLVNAKKEGSIVNIASIIKNGYKNLTVYAASKGAVDSFTFSAAKEFGPHGIRINSVSPGITDTSLISQVGEKVITAFRNTNPLGRIGKPEEIAEVICFLVSSKSSYVNGAPIDVNGGQL